MHRKADRKSKVFSLCKKSRKASIVSIPLVILCMLNTLLYTTANHEIHESTGFMDSLERTTARTYGQFKKKKKAAAAVLAAGGQKSPTTPPSPVSPITAVARTLPAVPSVCKYIALVMEE